MRKLPMVWGKPVNRFPEMDNLSSLTRSPTRLKKIWKGTRVTLKNWDKGILLCTISLAHVNQKPYTHLAGYWVGFHQKIRILETGVSQDLLVVGRCGCWLESESDFSNRMRIDVLWLNKQLIKRITTKLSRRAQM